MIDQRSVVLDVVGDREGGLRLEFFWNIDRYSHTISLIEGSRQTLLLASEEGASANGWPLSPPLTSIGISRSPEDGDTAILLLGEASHGHWSMSVERQTHTTALMFDVACRVARLPTDLGSHYRTKNAVSEGVRPDQRNKDNFKKIISTGERTVVLRTQQGTARFEVGDPRCSQRLVPLEPSVIRLWRTSAGLGLGPADVDTLDAASYPITLRWKYRVLRTGFP